MTSAPATRALAAAAAAGAVLLSACGDGGSDGSDGGRDGAGGDRTLTVLAAASLTEAFDEIGEVYTSERDGVEVRLAYDSSAVLAQQVVQGNPADVLATADVTTMQTVAEAGMLDGTPRPFATNTLVIVTPPDNPGSVRGIDDLGEASFAVCVPEAPCGDAAATLLELDGNDATPTTEEQNVRGVLTKVTLGEVDAGLVYRSDARAAGDAVATVEAANASEVVNVDPIAVLDASELEADAEAFVDLVVSDRGQQILADHGFGPAPS